jgi:hypothetical protein
MREELQPFIKFCALRLFRLPGQSLRRLRANPAFGEGRRSGALFFARHRDYFIVTWNFTAIYLDLVPFNSFIVTRNFSSVYLDWQKTRFRDPSLPLWAGSDGNSLNRRTVSVHFQVFRD